MSNEKFANILGLIVPEVVKIIVDRSCISETDAAIDFYKSEVYSMLQREETKVWHFSPLTLYNMYYKEKTSGIIDIPVEG